MSQEARDPTVVRMGRVEGVATAEGVCKPERNDQWCASWAVGRSEVADMQW